MKEYRIGNLGKRPEKCASALAGIAGLVAIFVLTACASSDVTLRQDAPSQHMIKRPDRILVHDFAATPADIPIIVQANFTHDVPETPQTPEQIEAGRQLGVLTARELVVRIQDMGMNAQSFSGAAPPEVGDVVVVGQLVNIEQGARGKRVLIGFGAGASELSFQIQGYLVTEMGPQWLGSRELQSSGGKLPGVIVPIAARSPVGLAANTALKTKGERGSETLTASAARSAETLADELRVVFQSNGWL